MKTLEVQLKERSYLIKIGEDLISQFETIGIDKEHKVFIVSNETVAPLYLDKLVNTLTKNNVYVDHFLVKDGEQYKTMQTWESILQALLKRNYSRSSILIALGGGVIGDVAGFAAACYQRGIALIQIPTTLLSQVDSSVGGKTAINHALGKNMIGVFYQPASVVIDINCLHTLPPREFSAGLAEVIKYGIILDAEFFNWLENNIEKLMNKESQALSECIYRCCELKAQIVAQDETEQGNRAILNLGHTYGHAIETHLGYGKWLHGEAVAVGILMAAHLSLSLGHLNPHDVSRIEQLLKKAQLPIARPKEMDANEYIPYMLRDKKVISGKIRIVLPTKIGHAIVIDTVNKDEIIHSINSVS